MVYVGIALILLFTFTVKAELKAEPPAGTILGILKRIPRGYKNPILRVTLQGPVGKPVLVRMVPLKYLPMLKVNELFPLPIKEVKSASGNKFYIVAINSKKKDSFLNFLETLRRKTETLQKKVGFLGCRLRIKI